MKNVTFQKAAPKTREELQLPILHFVAMDDWTNKIGEKAFVAWLKFYTWCNREADSSGNRPEYDAIPSSLTKIQKRLGVGKDTFYNQILKPLWNHGLIDVFEYKASDRKGQANVNIIVYPYPQNSFELAVKPLEKVRNYDTDYNSTAKGFAKLGGRPKKDDVTPRSEIEQGGCSEIEQGPRSEIEPNNVSKRSINVSNTYINNFEEEEDTTIPVVTIDTVSSIAQEKIKEREITNTKTIAAIMDATIKCRAIGTNDKQAAVNYVTRVVEEKMSLLGQKQRQQKQSRSTSKRTEMLPEWLGQDEQAATIKTQDVEAERKKIAELLGRSDI